MKYNNSSEICSILVSRICHDLVSPIGAISSGMEVYDEEEGEMREAAINLMRSSISKSVSLLTFARLAYGAAGTFGDAIDVTEAREVLDALFKTSKSDLEWNVDCNYMSKNGIKILVNLAQIIQEFAPRGGKISLLSDGRYIKACLHTENLYVKEDIVNLFSGQEVNLNPKIINSYLVYLLCKENNGSISCNVIDEHNVEIEVELADCALKIEENIS